SASMGKNKSKIFRTPVGAFMYQSIPSIVYPYGVARLEENSNPFLMAVKEKALCDTLSKADSITSIKSLETLLYDDLRVDRDSLLSLALSDIEFLIPLYRKKAIRILFKYLQKECGRA
ncbi:MAG: hypothetical protein AB1633_10820, partial [Elusimicrobiota bacterium]